MKVYLIIVDMEYGQDSYSIHATDMHDAMKLALAEVSKYAKCIRILESPK